MMRAYADPGSQLSCVWYTQGPADMNCTVVGYLVDVP